MNIFLKKNYKLPKIYKFFINLITGLFIFLLIYILLTKYYLNVIIFTPFLIYIYISSLKRNQNFTSFNLNLTKKLHITLIIPVKNEEKNIIECLSNIDKIDYPDDKMKVLVINDNSTDNTLDKINELSLSKKYKILDRKRKEGFVSGVLNDALNSIDFKTDIIGIIDADCFVSSNILEIINLKFQDFVGGIQIQEFHYNLENLISYSQHYGIIYDNFKMLKEPYFKVGHFYNYSLFEKIKYNEKSILEDMEFSDAILDLKYPVEVISDILIYRKFPASLKDIYSQQYRYFLGLNIINVEKNLFQEDIILGLILVFSFFTIFYNFRIGATIFIYLNLFGIILLNYILRFYLENINKSSLKNSPENLKNIISNLNQKNCSFLNIFLTNLYHIFLLKLRIISYIRYSFGIERIVWNRFS